MLSYIRFTHFRSIQNPLQVFDMIFNKEKIKTYEYLISSIKLALFSIYYFICCLI